jgi:hypothetical protein
MTGILIGTFQVCNVVNEGIANIRIHFSRKLTANCFFADQTANYAHQ